MRHAAPLRASQRPTASLFTAALTAAAMAAGGCAQLASYARPRLPEPVAGPPVQPGGDPLRNEAARFAALADEYRQVHGCRPLNWHATVARVAQAHSDDMARRSFFDHRNPDGLSPFDRLRAADVRFRMAAENIAYGQPAARQVLQGWIGSPGHRRNLENCTFTHHGVGFDGRYWTHILLTP